MLRRRRRQSGQRPSATVDMTSLIDLTFLLLVTFIVTLPALEQGISIILPKAQADPLPMSEDKKANTITCEYPAGYFLNDKPMSAEDIEANLKAMVAEDPDVPVLVRGDERLDYGSVMAIVKICYKCQVHKMALVTVDKK